MGIPKAVRRAGVIGLCDRFRLSRYLLAGRHLTIFECSVGLFGDEDFRSGEYVNLPMSQFGDLL